MAQFPSTTLHDMDPPFADMDGKKIRLLVPEGAIIGDIVISQNSRQKKFGMRVDAIVSFTTKGSKQTNHVKSWDLTKSQIDSIKRSQSQDVEAAFEVRVI